MSHESFLKILVQLYRLAGKPAIDGLYLPLSLSYSSNADLLIKKLIKTPCFTQYIENDEFLIDDIPFQGNDVIQSWKKISITIKLPRDTINRFHTSISELISFPSVRNGEFPSEFYIIDLDYHSDDIDKPSSILQVEKICLLIKALGKLAHYHDNRSANGEPRLVFIQGLESRSKTTILQPIITKEMVNFDNLDCNFVEELQDEISLDDVNHHTEKRCVFRNTLVEFTNDNSFDFIKLIENWKDFRLAYDNNLSVYLSGFSFHKARNEVALAELDFAEKTAKSVSDLTTKLLTLPLSLLAAVGIWKLKEITDQSIILSGVILTSFIINLIITSQHKQLKRIIHSKKMVFDPFKSKSKNYPPELIKDIDAAFTELKKNERFSLIVLFIFYILCWTPVLIGVGIMVFKIYYTPCE